MYQLRFSYFHSVDGPYVVEHSIDSADVVFIYSPLYGHMDMYWYTHMHVVGRGFVSVVWLYGRVQIYRYVGRYVIQLYHIVRNIHKHTRCHRKPSAVPSPTNTYIIITRIWYVMCMM